MVSYLVGPARLASPSVHFLRCVDDDVGGGGCDEDYDDSCDGDGGVGGSCVDDDNGSDDDDDDVIDDHLVGPGRVAEPSTEEEWGIGQIQT